jgi:hypothetical protein
VLKEKLKWVEPLTREIKALPSGTALRCVTTTEYWLWREPPEQFEGGGGGAARAAAATASSSSSRMPANATALRIYFGLELGTDN